MSRVQIFESAAEAIADLYDGAVIMVGGFFVGRPDLLIEALLQKEMRELTIIVNAPGSMVALAEKGQVRKFIISRPTIRPGTPLESLYWEGRIEVEMVAQGTLAERIRAGGAGIGGFYTPVGVGTVVEEGKEKRTLEGQEYLLELPLRADYAFIRAYKADRLGNLIYRRAERNFNPIMATAATVTIAEVDEVVEVGSLDPELISTPCIYVDRIVRHPEGAKQ